MAINFELVEEELRVQPVIKVIGVGGAGGNAVKHMIEESLTGVEFVVANTDLMALNTNPAPVKIQLGKRLTGGKGAGGDPRIGKEAAEESEKEIKEVLEGTDMVFITAGMGGGTGTGAAPVIAKICKEMQILTVGVVTKPFHFEHKRVKIAEEGIEELSKYVDALIVISNDKIMSFGPPEENFYSALKKADNVLYYAVKGISDVVLCPGHINLDFADVKAVLSDSGGLALMGMGEASGENRAEEALHMAISNPFLEDLSIKGARRVLINITVDPTSLTTREVQLINSRIAKEVAPDAMVYHGLVFNEGLGDLLRVTVIATGLRPELEEVEEERDEAKEDEKVLKFKPKSISEEEEVLTTVKKARKLRVGGFKDWELDMENYLDIPTFMRKNAD